jgi:hypothetical protein
VSRPLEFAAFNERPELLRIVANRLELVHDRGNVIQTHEHAGDFKEP